MSLVQLLTVALCVVACSAGPIVGARAEESSDASQPASALDFTVTDIKGQEVNLQEQYAGQVVLIVNTASKCGHTKQYAGLEALYKKHKDDGLVVLGFPCNQFKDQEPGTEEEIALFCQKNYGVTFPLFSKIDVNGESADPLYQHLTGPALPEDQRGPVKWNFEKFLVGRDGQVLARFASKVTPDSEALQAAVAEALAQPALSAE